MGSKKGATTTTTSDPWSGQQPYLQDLFTQAQGLFNQGPQQYYPGQTVAPFSPQTQMGMDLMTQRALGGSQQQDIFGQYLSGQLGQQNLDPSSIYGPAQQAAGGIWQGQNFMNQAGQGAMGMGQPNSMVGGAAGALGNSLGYGGLGEASQYAGSPAMGALPASQQYVQQTLANSPSFGSFADQMQQRTPQLGQQFGAQQITPQNVGAQQIGAQNVGAQQINAQNVGAQQLNQQFGPGGTAANELSSTASGGYLGSNPYLDQMFNTASGRAGEAFNEQTMPGIAAQFGSAGRTGSGIHQQVAGNAARQFGRDLQGMAADIYSPAYEAERNRQQQAAATLGGYDLQGQGLGLQQGQSNQSAALQAALANQGAGLQAGAANQNAALQAALANQGAGLQAGASNQSAALQAAMANQGAGLQAGALNQSAALQAAMANQGAGLQAGAANQSAGLQAQGLGLQQGMANQSAAMQGLGMAGDLYGGEQQRRLGAAGLGGDLFNSYNQADLGRLGLGANLYLGDRGLGQDAASQLGQLGLGQGQLGLGGYNTALQAGQGMGNLGLGGLGAMGDLYGNIAQNQFRAGSLMPSFNDMQYGDIQRLMGVGGMMEDQTQRLMGANQDRWNFGQQAPWQNMNNYANTIYGLPGGYGTQAQTQPGGSRLQGAFGGAMSGAALGPWGMLGGAVLGGLL